jgi:NAD(P)-dependent dehydrogenase (short-subunit alcohol dehydrogenase family)
MGNRLAGKVAVITGVASGIGRGCALMFAREGAEVVGCDRDRSGAMETAEMARAEGSGIDIVAPLNLSDSAGADDLVRRTIDLHGGLDILLTAAGHVEFAPVPEMTDSQWHNTITGELDVVFFPIRAAWPHMVTRGGGSIINFASVAAWGGMKVLPQVAHATGKGGVLSMTRQLALEGAPHRIRANTISPGMIVTPATKFAFQAIPGFEAAIRAKTLLERFGRPEDIAWAAVYFASDEASWVTGADLRIDGGAMTW